MDIQTVSIVLAGIGIFIAAVNSIVTSRQTNLQRQIELKNQALSLQTQQQALDTRQAELFAQVYARWTDTEFAKHYGAARWGYQWKTPEEMQKLVLEPYDAEAFASFHVLFAFFEGLGVFVKKGLINIDYIDDLFSRRVISLWEQFEQWIVYRRKVMENPGYVDNFEYLYNLMKQREQQATVSP